MRKLRVEAVARLARAAVPDVVGQHDEIAGGVEELARTKQFARPVRGKKTATGSARAMENHYGIAHRSLRVFAEGAEGGVVKPQLGERFARGELEVPGDVVALDALGGGGGGENGSQEK